MTLALEFIDGPLAGTTVSLSRGTSVLGRDHKQADIVLSDPLVSRRHLELTLSDRGCLVRDLGATNGTIYNGQSLSKEDTELRLGDELLISGRFRVRLVENDPEALLDSDHRCSKCGRDIGLETFAESDVLEQGGRYTCPQCLADNETTERISMQDVLAELRIGGYQVIEKLAEGGMGAVYKARQLSVNRLVALKTIRREFAGDEHVVKRFFQEAQTAARIAHPNVVMLHDTGCDDGVHYIAMEYIQGRSLQNIIEEQGRLPVHAALAIGHQIASALEAARLQGVVHRDIKPANIMVTADGTAKLTDFGIARALETSGMSRLTAQGMTMGTPYYMPPEQLTDAASADHRADIYSLGATLYHALAGRIPFPREGRAEMLKAIVRDMPEPLTQERPEVPPKVDAIIQKAMAKEPDKRFQKAGAMEALLVKALAGLGGE